MKNKTFHLLSLAHLPQNRTYSSCAFTQKNRKLTKMLLSLGHTVYFYGSEGSDVDEYCKGEPGKLHFIQTHTLSDIRKSWGDGDNRFEIGYDWTNTEYRHDFAAPYAPATLKMMEVAIKKINEVKKPDHFLLRTQGGYQKPVSDAVELFLDCEPGIGYRNSMPSTNQKAYYRAFESSYGMNWMYGYEDKLGSVNGNWYDRVIPNYFDPEDVEFSEEKEDYMVFIGRMINRKGLSIAINTANALGKKLYLIGQSAYVDKNGWLQEKDPVNPRNPEYAFPPGTWEYLGFKGIDERKKLLARAKIVFTPTIYKEMFGGTHVEARLSGTPVLTTNFGVYPGTVENGVDGFRCDTLGDFVEKAKELYTWDAEKYRTVRKRAERYLMENVRWDYQKWFDDLHQLYLSTDGRTKGWSYIRKEPQEWSKHITW